MNVTIAVEDPRAEDIRALLARHLWFAHEVTPEGHVQALPLEGLLDPAVTFFAARRGGKLVGVGALKRLDAGHAEVKSMHTAEAVRRQGVGRVMVQHLVAAARAQGCARVSLETGAMDAFAPARALYASEGFARCAPYGEYVENPHRVCMTLRLDG